MILELLDVILNPELFIKLHIDRNRVTLSAAEPFARRGMGGEAAFGGVQKGLFFFGDKEIKLAEAELHDSELFFDLEKRGIF